MRSPMVRAAVLGCAAMLSSCGAVAARPIAASELEPPGGDEVLEVQLEDRERPSLQLRFSWANRAARLGYGGVQMWARPERDEIRVTAIVDAPAKEARWERCDAALLLVDGRRVELDPAYIWRPMAGGTYDAVQLDLGIHQLRRIAAAQRVHGAICGDPFELTTSQRRSLARFVDWFDRIAQPRQLEDAPGFRAVGPEVDLLPHEDVDPGPYEA